MASDYIELVDHILAQIILEVEVPATDIVADLTSRKADLVMPLVQLLQALHL